MLDRLERRVLGAVRLFDAVTGRPLNRPLTVSAQGVRFLRNRAQFYVITAAPGLEEHVTAFEAPPALPAPGSRAVEIRIDDPLGEYLPRLARLPLPRSPEPGPGEPDLFQPERVDLLPAPAAGVRLNWGGLRLSLTRPGGRQGIRGALVELHDPADPGAPALALGLSDQRGEALAALAGLRAYRPADGGDAVTVSQTPVTVELVIDPAQPWPVDPQGLAARRAELLNLSLAGVIQLGPGRFEHRALQLALDGGP